MQGGWAPDPGAVPRQRDFPPVEPGRVVGLGAVCDLHPQSPADARDQSFTVGEFVALEDGRRVMLHDERGLTIGVRSGAGSDPGHVRDSLSLEQLTEAVLNVVLPDDDERDEEHPWEWLAHLARARGLEVTADDLRGLPYEVTFTDAVRRWLDA